MVDAQAGWTKAPLLRAAIDGIGAVMTERLIYKFKFDPSSRPISAPRGDALLVDYEQDGSELPTIWIEFTPGCAETRYFIRATGEQFDHRPDIKHVGSARCGRYVWHIYAGDR